MALSSRSRAELYQSLSRQADPEAVEEMLSNFPVRELDEPATKAFIEMRIGELEREVALLGQGINGLKADGRRRDTAIGELRSDVSTLKTDFGQMKDEFNGFKVYLHQEILSSTRWLIGMMFIMAMAIIGAQAWFG